MPESDRNTQQEKGTTNGVQFAHGPAALLRFRKQLIVLAHLAAFAVSLLLSFLVTSNMEVRRNWLFSQYPLLLPFFLVIKLPIFAFFKQYRGWWRYVGISA